MSPKRSKDTQDHLTDEQLWQATFDHLDHLDQDNDIHPPENPKGPVSIPHHDYPSYEHILIQPISGTQVLSFADASLSARVVKSLFKDPFHPDQVLDLHHMSGPEAYQACQAILETTYCSQQRRCRLICGQGHHRLGQSLLKGVCVYVLERSPLVLAYRSAAQKAGGTGAIDVYLAQSK